MTRIDRYLLVTYFRTLLICFFSLAGVFVVIHAFQNLEELAAFGEERGGLWAAVVGYYGPFLVALFDWTVDILAVMALMFTIAYVRRSGELTAILAAGIGHGRIIKPLLCASAAVILLAAVSREVILPRYRDWIGARPQDLAGTTDQALQPSLDRKTGVLIGGKGLRVIRHEIVSPTFFLHSPLGDYGPQLASVSGVWLPASEKRPAGYLLRDVTIPEDVASIRSAAKDGKTLIYGPVEYPELRPKNLFVVSEVPYELLQAGSGSRSYLGWAELVSRVRNPAAHVPADLNVALHSRPIRPLIDFAIVLASVSLVVGSADRHLFAIAGASLLLIIGSQLIKAASQAAGSSGYLFSPVEAAWLPLIVFGPIGYMRWRDACRK